jgi:L,D-peptidoglycan transpeptidase YkuD (ErfK/YbiS/YcfS/YnhG family)
MIIVKKSGYLKYKNFKFRCALGRAGIKEKKFEGDNVTPRGTYRIIKVFYRSDRIKNLTTKITKIKILLN